MGRSARFKYIGSFLVSTLLLTSACQLRKKQSSLSGEGSSSTPFFIDPDSKAQQAADRLKQEGKSVEAALIQRVARGTVSQWLASGNAAEVGKRVADYMQKAKSVKRLPVFVIYNIVERDCGSYSSGGAGDYGAYQSWIAAVADAVGNYPAWVIWEPDRILHDNCRHHWNEYVRAIVRLKQQPKIRVYIDAGHSGWGSPEATADKLRQAGIDKADGFSINVSNYRTDAELIAFGQKVKALVGKNFVIDSSRNGQGPLGDEWCNPRGRGLGQYPAVNTGVQGLDAYLWIKNPGESDGGGGAAGPCRGSDPKAGDWFESIALELARNARNADPPRGADLGSLGNFRSENFISMTGIECRGNQIYVDGWPDIICDQKCLKVGSKAKCEGDRGHWPSGPGQMGPDKVFRECRGNQVYVDQWPDAICSKSCFMRGYHAECEDGLFTWPTGPGQRGPDGFFRECRQKQIFVDEKPDVVCTKGCYMQGYFAKCIDDEDDISSSSNSTNAPSTGSSNSRSGTSNSTQSASTGSPNGGADGRKLAQLINCFASYLPNAAYRADNSRTSGNGCSAASITYCRTDKGSGDRFCKFNGTNRLQDSNDTPSCYFNCQMETCNAWDAPDTPQKQECVRNLNQ